MKTYEDLGTVHSTFHWLFLAPLTDLGAGDVLREKRQSQTARKRYCDLNLSMGHPRPLVLFPRCTLIVFAVKLILPESAQKRSEK